MNLYVHHDQPVCRLLTEYRPGGYQSSRMKKLAGVLICGVLISGCSNPPPPSAKFWIDKACSDWKIDGTRDYENALKNFAKAASIDSGYIEVSKSAQALKWVFVDKIYVGDETESALLVHLRNISAVCGFQSRHKISNAKVSGI